MVCELIILGPLVPFCCRWRPKSKYRIWEFGWHSSVNASHSHYAPGVLLCGGYTINGTLPPSELSSQTPASNQCARMKLTPEGIAAGWEVESMPGNRLMIDAIVMPDGNVLLINGAATGVSAFSIFDNFWKININSAVMYVRWLVMATFPMWSDNPMPITQVKPIRTFLELILNCPLYLISFDAVAVQTFGSRRLAIHHRLCDV